MARKKGDEITEDGYEFHSWEEAYFYWWVKVLIKAGYIDEVIFQPKSFQLSDPIVVNYLKPMKRVEDKYVPETIMSGKLYTCDACIKWNIKAKDIFFTDINSTIRKKKKHVHQYLIAQYAKEKDYYYSFIEVKPFYDQNNMTVLAIVNIKWVYEKYKQYVNIVIPEKLFEKTFTPKRFLFCDKNINQKRKVKIKKISSLRDFLDNSSLE